MHYNGVQCRIVLPLLVHDFELVAKLSALAMRNSAAPMLFLQPCAGRVPRHDVTAGVCFSLDPVVVLGFCTVGTSQGAIQHTIASTSILWPLFALLHKVAFASAAFPFFERMPTRIWS
jgi:hypothetical protein